MSSAREPRPLLRGFMQRLAGLRGNPWSVASCVGLVALFACVALFSRDAGMIWDEWLQVEYGERILRWFASGFRDRAAFEFRDLYLYGGLFDAPAQWLWHHAHVDLYALRHVLSALVAAAGIVVVHGIGKHLGGARAGFLAALLLFLTPAWTGHGLFNPKDIPFGAAAALVCYAGVRIATGPAPMTWPASLFAGLAVGLALAVRSGGMFLLGYVVCVALARAALAIRARRLRAEPACALRMLGQLGLRFSVATALAWVLMLSFWPWAQVDPFRRPLEAAHTAAKFPWTGTVLFGGKVYPADHVPRSYLPRWFVMTLPETYLVAFVAGCVALVLLLRARGARDWLGPKALAVAFLLASVCAPLLAVVIDRPIIYDAQRHFLFVLPPLAALGGIAVSGCLDALESSRARGVLLALLFGCAAVTARDMVALHPYEYVYFNRLSGGLPEAVGRYETDYWGASYEAGLAWLVRHVHPKPNERLRVANCSVPEQTAYYLEHWPAGRRFVFSDTQQGADYLLATTRYDCNKVKGHVVHVVEREHVPLLYVIRLPHAASRKARHRGRGPRKRR